MEGSPPRGEPALAKCRGKAADGVATIIHIFPPTHLPITRPWYPKKLPRSSHTRREGEGEQEETPIGLIPDVILTKTILAELRA